MSTQPTFSDWLGGRAMPDTPPGQPVEFLPSQSEDDLEWLKPGPIRALPEWTRPDMDVPDEQGQYPSPELVERSRLDHERERQAIESFPLIPRDEAESYQPLTRLEMKSLPIEEVQARLRYEVSTKPLSESIREPTMADVNAACRPGPLHRHRPDEPCYENCPVEPGPGPHGSWPLDGSVPLPPRLAHLAPDAPYRVCDGCGRHSWDLIQTECQMPQPDGARCWGHFRD